MKDIGLEFKEKRNEIGISIEEVGDDLKIDPILIENLEEGNNKVFKDIIELKDIITNYAKYLGLDYDKILDDLNDYLFEKTSKISVEDIKERLAKSTPVEKKIKSPYTVEFKNKKDRSKLFIIIAILLIVILLGLFYIVLRMILVG